MKKYLLFGLLIASFVVTGCGRKEPPKAEDPKSQARPFGAKDGGVGHEVLSFNLEGLTDKGDKKWEVIGRTARSISENEIVLADIVAKTYGDQEAFITADQGIYDKSKNNVRLEKNVKATIDNAGSIVNDQFGFPVDAAQSKKAGPEEASQEPKGKKKVTITCEGDFEFDYVKNLAYFNKNVKVRSDDGDIDADKITINLDPSTKKINAIIAQGHVKITQKGNTAQSDTAKYSEADKTVLLKGNPKIEIAQGDDTIKEKITER